MLRARRLLVPSLLACAAACAAPSAEVNLAPLYLRATAPGVQRTEALGGLARYEEDATGTRWALNPLLWRERRPDGSVQADFAVLLGRYEHDPERPRSYSRLFPLFWYEAERRPDGVDEVDWMLLPFFAGGSSSDDQENGFAFFPVAGRLKNFLAWEEVEFLLFPLWARTRKPTGTQTTQVLWPFFGWSEGRGEGWHVWPFYGKWSVPGRERSHYVLWPFWTRSTTELNLPQPRHSWFLFPLVGRIEQGDYSATTLLWPFLGRAERPNTGYFAWSLWPLLKFEEGGRGDDGRPDPRVVRRVVPFYIEFANEQTRFRSWLFPFFWHRQDDFGDMQREGFYALPLWWSLTTKRFDDVDGDGVDEVVATERVSRLFPFAARRTVTPETAGEEDRAERRIEVPYLSEPLARNLTRPLALWQSHRTQPDAPRLERAFLGLYHSLASGGHRRWSVPLIGGQWTEPDGTRHHSYLFGLLRWSTGPRGRGLETPAFPGPGWREIHGEPAGRPDEPR